MRQSRLIPIAACALIWGAAAVHADCIDDCMAAQDCSLNYSGSCASALGDCSTQCANQQPSGPAYGAIAYDRVNDAWGYAFNKNSEDAASAFALQKCAEHGAACEVMVTFSDACAALAAGKQGTASIVASVISNTKEEAQSLAVTRCQALGGEGCEIRAWSCSYP